MDEKRKGACFTLRQGETFVSLGDNGKSIRKNEGEKGGLDMGRIPIVMKDDAEGEVRSVYEDIEGIFGMIPNLFKTYAHFPQLLKANWEKTKVLMRSGRLSPRLKEAMALAVSKENSCKYCVNAHEFALKRLGVSTEEIRYIKGEREAGEMDRKDALILALLKKATRDPHSVTDEEIQSLKDAGVDDAELVEALGVMELFTGFNKFIDTIRIELDF